MQPSESTQRDGSLPKCGQEVGGDAIGGWPQEPVPFNLPKLLAAARHDTLTAMEMLPDEGQLARPGFGVPLLIAQGFDAARQVLIDDAESYGKPGLVKNVVIDAIGHNMFTVEGDAWLERRRPVAPVFATTGMNGSAEIMADTIAGQVAQWEPGLLDMQGTATDLTIRITCRGLLGVDPDDGALGQTIHVQFETLLAWISAHYNNPFLPLAWAPTRRNREMKEARRAMRAAVGELVRQRWQSGLDTDDILGRLVTAQREGPGPRNDDDIIDECMGFLFVGHETTASSLTWAFYELANHPEIQEEVALEGDRLDPGSTTLHDDAAELERTGSVVDEILRLYPSGLSIVRVARRATEICGHRVRRGTVVVVAVYRIQRRADAYDHPTTFDPDRPLGFAAPGLRHAFLPFGLGPRRCIGARFSVTEMRLALAMTCSRWRLHYRGEGPPIPRGQAVLAGRGHAADRDRTSTGADGRFRVTGIYRPSRPLGIFAEFGSDPIGLLDRLVEVDAPVVRAGGGVLPVWVVQRADAAVDVLQRDAASYRRPPTVNWIFRAVSGTNVFTSSGQEWQRRRRIIWPRLTQGAIDDAFDRMHRPIEAAFRNLGSGTIPIQALGDRVAMAAIAAALFGDDATGRTIGDALSSSAPMADWLMSRLHQPLLGPPIVPTPSNRRFVAARRELRSALRSVIEARLVRAAGSDQAADVLQALVLARDEETGRPLEIEELVDECLGLLFTGHETTGSALAWMLCRLAETPGLQERLRAGVAEPGGAAAPARTGRWATSDGQAVVDETLRLHPTAWATARLATRPTTAGGVAIPRWGFVLVSFYSIHRDASAWSRPTEFLPDRRERTEGGEAYLPFGVGPRRCIGDRLAVAVLLDALASAVTNVRLDPLGGASPRPDVRFAMKVDEGHHLGVTRLDAAMPQSSST